MGTRGLTMVMQGGEYKVSQYGQWDHYPSGQGLDVLKFLKGVDMDRFRENVAGITEMDTAELRAMWEKAGADKAGTIEYSKAQKFSENHPEFSRDTGAGILNIIMERPKGLRLQYDTEFAADSLFCEYVYVIDLDLNVLEVYQGFNETKLDKRARFGKLRVKKEKTGSGAEYQPVRLIVAFAFDYLPDEETFLKVCEKKEVDSE